MQKKTFAAVTSLPFVSPFSDHSTVTLRVLRLMLLTTAAWILPINKQQLETQ